MKMRLKKLEQDARIPVRATKGAAGYDLFTCTGGWIPAGETRLFKLGIAFEIPEGYEMVIRPRSGISLKTDNIVMIGTIDEDYRGNVGIIVKNIGRKDFYVTKNFRLAQAVFHKVEHFDFEEVDNLSKTDRGSGGFGHTGLSHGIKPDDLKNVIDELLANQERKFKQSDV